MTVGIFRSDHPLAGLFKDPGTRRFFGLSTAFIFMVGLSSLAEEWIFKSLPGFHFYWTVAFVELSCFTVGAAIQRRAFDDAAQGRRAPLRLYILAAVCLAYSQAFGKIAFKYLNYVTGTVVKSAKLLPTMALNIVWLQREVPRAKWIAAVLLVASASFMAFGESAVDVSFNPLGLVFSAINLCLAAVQGNLQECVLKDHSASVGENMYYMNGLGAVVVLGVMVAIQELVPATAYFASSPLALMLLVVRSVTFYFGGLFCTMLTKEFGTSTATSVGTARKTLTVMFSFLLFPKPFHVNYVFGLLCFVAAESVYLIVSLREGPKAAAAVGGAVPRPGYELVGRPGSAVEAAQVTDQKETV